jgi:hypothetical protein
MRLCMCLLVLSTLAGCGPSIADLRAQRDELEEMQDELAREAVYLDMWFDKLDRDERQGLEVIVDEIRGDEFVNVARDKKKAELIEVNTALERVRSRLSARVK